MGKKMTDAMVQSQHDCMFVQNAKKHLSKHSRVYSSYQIDIGSEAFKRAFVTHPNALTIAAKGRLKTSDCGGRERKKMLKENLEKKCHVLPPQQLLKK